MEKEIPISEMREQLESLVDDLRVMGLLLPAPEIPPHSSYPFVLPRRP
jgi:hypothetical protein